MEPVGDEFAWEKLVHVAHPLHVIAPKRILKQVVAGVRDYGNRMGIPTVSGAVYFHPDYLGNPLVFAGCVGLIPFDKCFGNPRKGDRIIALNPELPTAYAQRAQLNYKLGEYQSAKNSLERFLELESARPFDDPEVRQAYDLLSKCEIALGGR